jgi:hypothetical protein
VSILREVVEVVQHIGIRISNPDRSPGARFHSKDSLGLCSSSLRKLHRHGDETEELATEIRRYRAGFERAAPKKPKKRRPNSILLADLFLWINVVDDCHYHPVGTFDRAAVTEGYGSLGNVVQRIKVLEERFGPLFRPNKRSPRNRSGVPTQRGAALAEIFMLIELLFHWASTDKSRTFTEVRELKELILYLVPRTAPRIPDQDDLDPSRIVRSLVWHNRLDRTGRPRNPKRMSEWPAFGPSPVKRRHSSTSARSRS